MKPFTKNEVDQLKYTAPSGTLLFIILLSIFFFIVGFSRNFSISKKIDLLIAKQISIIEKQLSDQNIRSQIPCRIDYKNPDLSYFFPRYKINSVHISQGCIANAQKGLKLKSLSIGLSGLNPWPIGLNLTAAIEFDKQKFQIYFTQGFSEQIITIKENKLFFEELAKIVNAPIQLSGDGILTAQVTLAKQSLKKLILEIKSNNLKLPPQSINIAMVPNLKINELNLKTFSALIKSNKENSFEIKRLEVGEVSSPVRLQIAGKVLVSPSNMGETQLDIKGQFALSDQFLSDFAIIKLFLGKFKKKEDLYFFQLSGPLIKPNVTYE